MRAGIRFVAVASMVFLAACEASPTDSGKVSGDVNVTRSAASAPMPAPIMRAGVRPEMLHHPMAGAERFPDAKPNIWQPVDEQPVSTFSIDVDTASYAFVRRSLREGRLPPPAAVRVEEMVNYFPYAYPAPPNPDQPFAASVTVTPSPWTKDAKLLHIGIKGYDLTRQGRPRANLTFLVDTSGSMAPQDRLPLVKEALRQLRDGLKADDKVAIVTYAGDARVALDPTPGSDVARIEAAIASLGASGGTHGAAGINTAYALAESMFDREAVNRVVLATDGDFNVGVTDPKQLERMVADKRKTGIYLTVLGVGAGNLNDALMQRLAQTGNGQAAYLDSVLEARKVWIEELGSTMFPIADDVKIQLEFNPAQVAEYRLVGYETRMLARTDFNNDHVDAGDIGSGHSVTAIYEVMPAKAAKRKTEPLRYGKKAAKPAGNKGDELAFLRIRHKLPGAADSRLFQRPIKASEALASLDHAHADVRFAVAVAGFAQLLRGDISAAGWTFDRAVAMADGARGVDPNGWRGEFVQLVRAAGSLKR